MCMHVYVIPNSIGLQSPQLSYALEKNVLQFESLQKASLPPIVACMCMYVDENKKGLSLIIIGIIMV